MGWVSVIMGSLFYILYRLKLLRIFIDEEIVGFDIFSYGGYVYRDNDEGIYYFNRKYGDYVRMMMNE